MSRLFIVHCVDTEGPLNETLEVTFNRIYNITGKNITPSKDMLEKIQNGEIDLNGKEEIAKFIFSKRFLNYNRNWKDLDEMLDLITSEKYRSRYKDSYGTGWKYSWFIVDFADYTINPRDRIIGYHAILDHYKTYYERHNMSEDDFQWHAHPMSTYYEAHHCATCYINSPHIIQSLARNVIDRGFFPACFRPGFHTERPDSHWLLEQYIPYDYGNQAITLTDIDREQVELSDGRFGDWRRAPATWESYHPAHDDYQSKGNCNRVIFRCLNIGTRVRCINQNEVDKAFCRVNDGEDTILAIVNHDFRHMEEDIDEVYEMIKKASYKYPNVKWINSTAYDAAKAVTNASGKKINIDCEVYQDRGREILHVKTNIDTFGPQPFLTIKMCGGRYQFENFDFQVPKREWTYTFDEDSIRIEDVECIGVATNSLEGSGALCVIKPNNEMVMRREW